MDCEQFIKESFSANGVFFFASIHAAWNLNVSDMKLKMDVILYYYS